MLKTIWNYLVRVQKLRAAYWMLHSMSNSQLNDIGITRGDIRRIMNEG